MRTAGEIVAVASVVFSLIFVGYELQLSRKAAQSEYLGIQSNSVQGLRIALVDNAEVWKKGCLGEELTDTEKVQFLQLVEIVSLRAFFAWRNSDLGLSNVNPDQFPRNMALNLYRFPALKETFDSIASAGPQESMGDRNIWNVAVEEQYELLESLGIDRNATVELCGR
ncbi:MAG: hypothetical protein RLP12_00910 [Ekhidna sp.]